MLFLRAHGYTNLHLHTGYCTCMACAAAFQTSSQFKRLVIGSAGFHLSLKTGTWQVEGMFLSLSFHSLSLCCISVSPNIQKLGDKAVFANIDQSEDAWREVDKKVRVCLVRGAHAYLLACAWLGALCLIGVHMACIRASRTSNGTP